ncbi:MAG: DUF6870 family protein [Faecousia sp.]
MNMISARTADRSSLKDIRDVVIDTTKPCSERIKGYIDQIGNPYCYLDNGVVVEIGYSDTDISLHDRLLSYASSIDQESGKSW